MCEEKRVIKINDIFNIDVKYIEKNLNDFICKKCIILKHFCE